jgi:hypothetical protein
MEVGSAAFGSRKQEQIERAKNWVVQVQADSLVDLRQSRADKDLQEARRIRIL